MLRRCPTCGQRVLTISMTEEEERVYAAAFRCIACMRRYLEAWPEGEQRTPVHVAIEEK
jgi:DNA-directed RNA polymerase subunit RPC12/RpoP